MYNNNMYYLAPIARRRQISRHNFEHNRCLGIMPSIIGEFSSIILFS